MLQELTFVDSVLLITVFDLAAVRGKFSCKNTPKFTARPELGRTNPDMPLLKSGMYCRVGRNGTGTSGPHGGSARDFVNFREKNHASRARGAAARV